MNHSKQYIALFFLTVFIAIKAAGLHALMHLEESEEEHNCEVCEYVIIKNKVPSIVSEIVVIEFLAQFVPNNEHFSKYSYLFTKSNAENTLFCRPPPVF